MRQRVGDVHDRGPVPREDRAGERIGRAAVADLEGGLELAILVDPHREHRTEDLLTHEREVRPLGQHHGGLHEVALAVVTPAPGQDRRVRRLPRVVEVALDRREGVAIDNGAHEVGEIGRIADPDLGDLREQAFLHRGPERRWDERPRRRRALLALVLEGATGQRRREGRHAGRGVGEDEILPAGLADDPRIGAVAPDVAPDGLPHALKRRGRSREVDAGQRGRGERRVADLGARARHHIDDAGRQARGLEDLHDAVGGVERGRRRLPHDRVAQDRGRRRQIAADRREVERRDREHEPLERPVLEPVPGAGRGQRLLAIDLLGEGDVEPPEVDQLARRVDLGLMRRLRLAEHRGGVQGHPIRPGQEIGGPQKDGRALVPGQPRPVVRRGGRRVDGALHLGGAGLVPRREDVAVVVGHDNFRGPARRDPTPADARRDLDHLAGHPVERGAEGLPFRAARGVGEDGLVARDGHVEDPVAHRGPPLLHQVTSGRHPPPPRRFRRDCGRAPRIRR